ncbi:MAG: alginate export family protein [Endomicrobia bacterium]|nr:alginate export family protein [Endomicrobiia bacterium]
MKKVLIILALALFAAQTVLADAEKKIGLIFDGAARIRYEFYNHSVHAGLADDEQSYFRFKFSGGVLADFYDIFSIYGKLTNESRSYIYNALGDAQYDIDETVIDNLFFNIPKLFGAIDIKAGRMDLPLSEYGEGFLFADGTPLDGSRTFYFNAARIRYSTTESSIELLGIYDPEYDELSVINDKDKKLNDSLEKAFVIYGRSKINEKLYIEPYYMLKTEESGPFGKDVSINVFGSYVKYDMGKAAVRAQAAAQLGNYGDEAGRAFGGYAYLDIPVKDIVKPFSIGYVYLSGDDESTKTVEAWNPVFGRFPMLSEIMHVLYIRESGLGYWTNLQMLKFEATFKPLEKMSIITSYNFVYANETITNTAGTIFGTGKHRGDLIRCRVGYNFSKNFSSYILGEYFIPGDFYYKDAQDASFLRIEFMAKI